MNSSAILPSCSRNFPRLSERCERAMMRRSTRMMSRIAITHTISETTAASSRSHVRSLMFRPRSSVTVPALSFASEIALP